MGKTIETLLCEEPHMVGGPQPWSHHPLVQPKVARIPVLLQVVIKVQIRIRFRVQIS